jgi:hypothetical protein
MTDTAIVQRSTGVTTAADGTVTHTWATVYSGPAKRQTYEALESSPKAGGATITVQRYAAHFPVGEFVARVDDRVTWLTSQLDPGLPGRVDRVAAILHKTSATAYRVGVEEVTSFPEEA